MPGTNKPNPKKLVKHSQKNHATKIHRNKKMVIEDEEDQQEQEQEKEKEKEKEEEVVDDDDDFEDVEDDDHEKQHDQDEDEEINANGQHDKKTTTKKITLYDLLDISKDATIEQIKKGYKQLALKIHPDKNRDDPQAKERFQKIVDAYTILSDPEKKKIYDETGSYGDEFNQHAFESAYNYYRSIYKKIEKEDIVDFESKYRGSEMEEEDLINFYNENNGDLTKILECIPLSRNEDVERFIKTYEEMFVSGKLKLSKNFKKSKSQIILLDEDEEDGFQEAQNGLKDLAQQILAKKGNASHFLDQLAEKYGGCSSKKTKSSSTQKTKPSKQMKK